MKSIVMMILVVLATTPFTAQAQTAFDTDGDSYTDSADQCPDEDVALRDLDRFDIPHSQAGCLLPRDESLPRTAAGGLDLAAICAGLVDEAKRSGGRKASTSRRAKAVVKGVERELDSVAADVTRPVAQKAKAYALKADLETLASLVTATSGTVTELAAALEALEGLVKETGALAALTQRVDVLETTVAGLPKWEMSVGFKLDTWDVNTGTPGKRPVVGGSTVNVQPQGVLVIQPLGLQLRRNGFLLSAGLYGTMGFGERLALGSVSMSFGGGGRFSLLGIAKDLGDDCTLAMGGYVNGGGDVRNVVDVVWHANNAHKRLLLSGVGHVGAGGEIRIGVPAFSWYFRGGFNGYWTAASSSRSSDSVLNGGSGTLSTGVLIAPGG